MQTIDWIIILLYLIITMALGIYLSGKASKSMEDFFVSGRSLSWWLAGTSMAATTFSIDTPLYICGVVATRGIAGNWEWWSFGISHVVLIYIFARLWRRSEVVTDAELTELRYSGKMAAILRATKGFLFAVPINCIGIGYAMLAMVKVVSALELWESLGFNVGESGKLWSVIAVSIFVLIYSGFSGLWGVVITDFFQFFLGLFGAFVVAIVAVNHVGGIHELIPAVQKATDIDVLSVIPLTRGEGLFNWRWSDVAGISLSTFSAYLLVQWWSFRRSDGGGEFIQRLVSAKDEAEAEKAAWFFNILHYIIRTWPWILVALVAIVIYPDLDDRELGYPKLMLDFLPPAMLGLVVASLIAAFMSTVSTSINWGASYLTNDLYRRFFAPNATQAQLVLVGRIASVVVTVTGAIAAFFAQDVSTVFRLVIAIGTGPGLVLILRWYWWRINATAELTAMVAGFIIGLTSVIPNLNLFPADFGLRLMIISGLTAIIWISAMYLTPPESEETLTKFYLKVRPAGIGWRKQQEDTGIAPLQNLKLDSLKVVASIFLLFGLMLSIGGFLLLQSFTGWVSLIFAVGGGFWLRHLNKQKIFPMPRPGVS
ncbi:sodium:solute symporter family protein [Geminocystis herdmanii]|uniref:sodium:solute symporter family protein n=1 Tax=Geminocystis herdmanii TaxID=669359 RepID=UPI00034DA6E4|nr:sodium:solute symporter family protein [Geminocystis herdmanii]